MLQARAQPAGREDTRSRDQRWADALVSLADEILAFGELPTTAGHRPEITIHATEAAITSDTDAPPPRLDDGTPLTCGAFNRIACDARWRRLLLDAHDIPLSYGRARRDWPPAPRKFITLRDGGCRWGNCPMPASACEVHHCTYWENGGETCADNGLLLCRWHHHCIHNRGHQVKLLPDNTADVTLPDGRVLISKPRGPTPVERVCNTRAEVPTGGRVYVMTSSDQKAVLRRYLQWARDALLWKLDGLGEYDLRRPMTPTGTNLLGLVKHVASVEAWYFGDTFGRPFGEPLPWFDPDAEPNADMWATAEETPADILALYERARSHADQTIVALDLDAPGEVPWWPPDSRRVTLHHILVHHTVETNRHAGHADVIRELIDGRAGLRADNDNLPPADQAWWAGYVARLEGVTEEAGRPAVE